MSNDHITENKVMPILDRILTTVFVYTNKIKHEK